MSSSTSLSNLTLTEGYVVFAMFLDAVIQLTFVSDVWNPSSAGLRRGGRIGAARPCLWACLDKVCGFDVYVCVCVFCVFVCMYVCVCVCEVGQMIASVHADVMVATNGSPHMRGSQLEASLSDTRASHSMHAAYCGMGPKRRPFAEKEAAFFFTSTFKLLRFPLRARSRGNRHWRCRSSSSSTGSSNRRHAWHAGCSGPANSSRRWHRHNTPRVYSMNRAATPQASESC